MGPLLLTDVAEEFGPPPWSLLPVGHHAAPDIVPNCVPKKRVGARVGGRLAMSVVPYPVDGIAVLVCYHTRIIFLS